MNLTEAMRDCSVLEHAQRLLVIEEAVTWLGTPYIAEARLKDTGTDCAQFMAAVYIYAGAVAPFKVAHLGALWHLHTSEELYLRELLNYAHEIPGPPLPGDIAVFHVKRAYAHAGIVVEWPTKILHCLERGGVQWGDASRDAFLIMEQRQHPPKFFSVWKREPEE